MQSRDRLDFGSEGRGGPLVEDQLMNHVDPVRRKCELTSVLVSNDAVAAVSSVLLKEALNVVVRVFEAMSLGTAVKLNSKPALIPHWIDLVMVSVLVLFDPTLTVILHGCHSSKGFISIYNSTLTDLTILGTLGYWPQMA